MKLRPLPLVLALLAVLLPVTTVPSGASATGRWRVDQTITLLGDSLTTRGRDDLVRLGADWRIEDAPGRPIDALPYRIKARLAQGANLRMLIVAYGSNASPDYDADDLLSDLALVPSSTIVILVSPYKLPSYYDPKAPAYQNPMYINRYAAMFATVAAKRPHTCVAPWAAYAKAHPKRLKGRHGGGVHPDAKGQKVWAQIIKNAQNTCR
ncbi:hypothetical protein ABIE44_001922 [Marmoricola sp. OAE513]|uniref:hypothetical protein n=1 Tax=Marmoricola sp. OAE513 TaxID=2817894 RepID=UPI001AE64676